MAVRQIVFKQEGMDDIDSIELQTDEGETISLQTVERFFPGVQGIKYFCGERHRWRR